MRQGIPHWFSARRRRMLLALPVLVLRALLPVGFMPVSDRGGFHIDFCPGEAQPPGALAAQPLAHHHHHGGADHGAPSPASHAPCLFALSGSPAFAPAAPAVAPPPPAASALAADLTSRVSLPAILRAQSARAPPQIA
ncbi:MAG TPA: hypothetical protein VGH61_08705 [Steroidobacteraceae bacterium]